MDITFACEKCGQHLVIDEAGASLAIQCPKCGVSLTVPKPPAPSPPPDTAPSSEELGYRCRDLAYELRVEDAICVLQEAEKARAREKGYQLSDAFIFHGTAQSVIERARWAIAQSLQNLTPKEEREILGALVWQELSGSSHRKGCEEMRAVVVGGNLQWPVFEEWFRRCKESHTWPSMWEIVGNDEEGTSQSDEIDFYESELAKPTDPLLAQMHEQSLSARRLLFGRRIDLTPDALHDGGIELETAISELVTAGFARRCAPASLEKRLECLSLKWLQALQKKYGVTVPRAKKGEAPKDYFERRQRILQPLMAAIGAEKLSEELPPEAVFELIQPDVPRADFERFRAELLAHTLCGMMATYRDYKSLAELNRDFSNRSERLKMKALLTDDCPFCLEASKRLERVATVTLEMLPPFHPGCRCCTTVSERVGGEP